MYWNASFLSCCVWLVWIMKLLMGWGPALFGGVLASYNLIGWIHDMQQREWGIHWYYWVEFQECSRRARRSGMIHKIKIICRRKIYSMGIYHNSSTTRLLRPTNISFLLYRSSLLVFSRRVGCTCWRWINSCFLLMIQAKKQTQFPIFSPNEYQRCTPRVIHGPYSTSSLDAYMLISEVAPIKCKNLSCFFAQTQ